MRTPSLIVGLTIFQALALTGCTDILSPPRVDPYEYRLTVVEGGETYKIAFHWPRTSLPIKVWVADDDPLVPAVQRAMKLWEDNFLYGEVRLTMVASEAEADIVVRNQSAPAKVQASMQRLASMAPECQGATDLNADPEAGTLTLPIRVYVSLKAGSSQAALETCYQLTTLHEFGHALGLLEHSSSQEDLMAQDPTRNSISERDGATLEAVYHLPSTVVPVKP